MNSKSPFTIYYALKVFSATLVLLICGFIKDVPVAYLELKGGQLQTTPKEFYIAGIADDRNDLITIGSLQAVAVPGKTPAACKVEIKGGAAAIKKYMSNSLPVNKNLRPVTIRIKSLNITEVPLPAGRVKGHVGLSLSFGLRQEEDFNYLGDYTGGADYERNAGPPQQLEHLVKTSIDNGLIYINNWMNARADNHMKLARGVKIFFTDHREAIADDTVYYDVNRPLNWSDFREKPHIGSKYGAETFTMIGYNEQVKLIKGIIYILMDVKVFLPKSSSWVQAGGLSKYGLNHEQRHFDITRIVAEHFKQNLKKETFSIANYDAPINVAYLDALRELNKLQKQYDEETGHSINAYRQEQWNNKIDKELKELGIIE